MKIIDELLKEEVIFERDQKVIPAEQARRVQRGQFFKAVIVPEVLLSKEDQQDVQTKAESRRRASSSMLEAKKSGELRILKDSFKGEEPFPPPRDLSRDESGGREPLPASRARESPIRGGLAAARG